MSTGSGLIIRSRALLAANSDRQKAARIATEIFEAIHDNLAAKADLQQLEQLRMLLRMTEINAKIDCTVTRLGSLMVIPWPDRC
jgi:hypothetical protein